ncbi:hypothetical protein EZ456_23770 [Pedobacter psychrodurus]|uniref:Outer membrane efflux protein n=1 Tax=Pedobacter psychrodurus TaxID=2530456 RepID=A0A4R0PG08_9SPHI|nr:hypothetical protein [Pedobacter psychrodurus]TCD16970.1 hypothetical protein EZ456_23770 [Pedobacter psychrodurus]
MKRTFLSLFSILTIIFVASAQQDSSKVLTLNLDKLLVLERSIKYNDSISNKKIKDLEARITNLNIPKSLKSANIIKFKNDIAALQNRYIAGEEILNHIVRETNSFNLSYQTLVMQNDFSALVNPANFPEFTSSLSNSLNSLKDKKPIPDITSNLSNLTTSLPFMSNPLVTNGLSIASFFIAKYNDKRKFGIDEFNKMTCVLDFTSATDDNYKVSVQRILYLRDKIDKYNAGVKEFFDLYLNTIDFKDGYTQYSTQKNLNASDFLKPKREQLFNSILSDTTSIGIVASSTDKDDNIVYHIEQIKFFVAEYESIIREIGGSIDSYSTFHENLERAVQNSCLGVKVVAEPKLVIMKKNIENVQKAFKVVAEQNVIPAKLKMTLLGL